MLVKCVPDSETQRRIRQEEITMADIVGLRTNKQAYKFYVDIFFGCVRGKKEWRKLRGKKCLQDCSTINDEAYGLLVLENYWDLWTAMQTNNTKTMQELQKKMTGELEDEAEGRSTKKYRSMYTVGGQGQGGTKKHRGWNQHGIERFIELVDQIKADRQVNRRFDEEYLQGVIEEKRLLMTNDYRKKKDEDDNVELLAAPREALSDSE